MSLGSIIGGGAGLLTGGMVTGGLAGLAGAQAGNAIQNAITTNVNPTVTGFNPNQPLSQTNALPGQNYYNPAIDNTLIPSQEGRTATSYGAQFNYGINPNQGDLSNPNPLPGSANDPTVQAINAQADKQTANALRGITTQNQQQGTLSAAQEQNTVGQEAGAEWQNQVQNFNQQYQYEMNRYTMATQYQTAQQQAQASLWGSVFGGIGKLAGAGLSAVGI